MADLSVAQRAALAQLIERCPDRVLSQLSGLAGTMAGDRAWALRDLVEVETLDRRRRQIALGPLTPLFRPRADGLPGLDFPAAVLGRLWREATRNEPELLPQLDRDDDLSRMIADRLCLSAAVALRDRPEAVWPEAVWPEAVRQEAVRPETVGAGGEAARTAELAACLDLAAVARRALPHLPDWISRSSPEATAELKLALRQAAAIAPDGASRLLEIIFAHLQDARLILRVVGLAAPGAGRDLSRETALGESELGVFVDRVLLALARRASEVAAFDPAGAAADMAAFKADLDWCAETLAEIDVVLPLKPDSAWGKAVRQARLKVGLSLSERFSAAEKAVDAVLPVQRTTLAGRMTRPAPRLDQAVDAAAAARARALAALVGLVRGPAAVFGCEAERRQTAEALTGRLAVWADEAIERLNDGQLSEAIGEAAGNAAGGEAVARKRIALTVDLLGQVGAREAARTVRRRLMAAGAASRVSPPVA